MNMTPRIPAGMLRHCLPALLLLLPFGLAAQPQFEISPPTMSLQAPVGFAVNPKVFRITNLSGSPSFFETILGDDGLIDITPRFGPIDTDPVEVTVTFSTTDLEAGYYFSQFQVDEVFPARGAPLTVPISLHMYNPGPPTITFFSVLGDVVRETGEGYIVSLFSETSFEVEVEGSPPFDYQWQHSYDGEEYFDLSDGPIYTGTQTIEMIGPEFYPEDAGYYRVQVSNRLGTTFSDPWRMDVPDPPFILDDPLDITVVEGDPVAIDTFAVGFEPMEYEWIRIVGIEAISLAEDPAWFGATNDVLTSSSISLGAAGEYYCIVSNEFGDSFSQVAELKVLEISPPEIMTQPTAISVAEGGTANLSIIADSLGIPSYQWEFSRLGQVFTPLIDGFEIMGATSEMLTISNIALEQDGLYRCVVSNSTGSATSNAVQVTVEAPPLLITDVLDTEVPLGETAFFRTDAIGSPPLTYFWEFASNGLDFFPIDDGSSYSGTKSNRLAVFNAGPSVEGAYRCVISNPFGPSIMAGPGQLTTITPPPVLFVENPDRTLYVREGENAEDVTFTLENIGQGSIRYSVLPGFEATWVSQVTPLSGTITASPVDVTVSFDTTGLLLGTFITPISVQSLDVMRGADLTVTINVVDPFAVTNLEDAGPGSLRDAITRANILEGPQTISFVASGTIFPLSPLPPLADLTGGTAILGNDEIIISGAMLTERSDGLVITSANNQIRDLTIVRFPGNGIVISGTEAMGNTITGSRIGIDEGEKPGNRGSGILLADTSGNIIGGDSPELENIISGNSFSAITVDGSDQAQILGNSIGIPLVGTRPAGNEGHGVHFLPVPATENLIGGTTVFDRNANIGSRFYTTSVDVLEGNDVELEALAQAIGSISYQWFKDGTGTSSMTSKLSLINVRPSTEGLYFCRVSNANGFNDSEPIFVRVLTRSELLAIRLLPKFPALDTNLDSGLSFTELEFTAGKEFRRSSRGATGFTQAEFDGLDLDDDGFIDIEELMTAQGIDISDLKLGISPMAAGFQDMDIDEGAGDTVSVTLDNVGDSTVRIIGEPKFLGMTEEFEVVEDSGESELELFGIRVLQLNSDPAALNHRVGYLLVESDDFLMPVRPVLLSGFGFQTTPELLDQMIDSDSDTRQLNEQDVNEDQSFDAADIQSNRLQGR